MAEPASLDTTRPIAERVHDLVSRMTLQEKVSQMVHRAPAIERLGVPEYNWWNECLHGVARAGVATVFPQAIGIAATWNVPLMSEIATATADEARAKHHDFQRRGIRSIYTGLTFWSPNVNIFRDPRWGRGQETYGEDPYLSARMGVAFVKALQGDDPRYLKLVATPKHYAAHSGKEAERHFFDARVSERDMRETYLPAFEACVREGKAVSVMGAYNRTNGEACCASPTLLQKILRDEWGFDGYVVSDCGAIDDIYMFHGLAKTPAEAAALAVKNGCELNCGSTYPALLDAVVQGLISEKTVTEAVEHLFSARFRLGMFDPPEMVPYAKIPIATNCSARHRKLARRAAQESIVLLKNEGRTLPLRKDIASIAVIGPNADDVPPLVGNYNGTPAQAVTVLEGIRRKVGDETTVYYSRGCDSADGVPALTVIPPACLRPQEADAGAHGLTGEYFSWADLTGAVLMTRLDPVVDFWWKERTPLGNRPGDPFAVRWTGYLVPPVSGTYKLGVNASSSYELFLDGQQVVKHRGEHHPYTRTKDITLEAGRLYALRLDFTDTSVDPAAQLLWSVPGISYEAEAVAVAQKADAVVLVMGLTAALEGEEMPVHVEGFSGGDRTDITLPRPQEELVRRIAALGKPVVLVLMSGSALALPWAAEHVPAIVQAWYPGESGGVAVADVLFGDYSPAGRLPVTFYTSVNDLPPFADYNMEGHTYRYFRGEPLYAFGHGLSYTTFAYSNLRLSAARVEAGQGLTVTADVKNTGRRVGDEVVQLYLSDGQASAPTPIRQLAGFARVHLKPHETETVSFTLTARQMSLIDDRGKRVVEPGTFLVAVGGRQPRATDGLGGTAVLTTTFEVTGHTTEVRS